MDLNKIYSSMVDSGLVLKTDDETAVISAIGAAADSLKWYRQEKARREMEAKEIEANMNRTGSIKLGCSDD